LRHGFINTKAFLNVFNSNKVEQTVNSTLAERGKVFINYFGRFIWLPPKPDLFVEEGLCRELSSTRKNAYPEMAILALLILAFFIYTNQKSRRDDNSKASRIVSGIFISSLLAVFFYNRSFQEYYLSLLTPFLAVVLAVVAELFWQKKSLQPYVFSFFCLFLTFNLITLFSADNSYSIPEKKETIQFVKNNLQGANYSLEALGDCPRFAGWRYLFEYYYARPATSYMDSYFGWLYQDKNIQKSPVNTVLLSMIDPRADYGSIERWQEEKIRYLNNYIVLAQDTSDNIHVFILAPK